MSDESPTHLHLVSLVTPEGKLVGDPPADAPEAVKQAIHFAQLLAASDENKEIVNILTATLLSNPDWGPNIAIKIRVALSTFLVEVVQNVVSGNEGFKALQHVIASVRAVDRRSSELGPFADAEQRLRTSVVDALAAFVGDVAAVVEAHKADPDKS